MRCTAIESRLIHSVLDPIARQAEENGDTLVTLRLGAAIQELPYVNAWAASLICASITGHIEGFPPELALPYLMILQRLQMEFPESGG